MTERWVLSTNLPEDEHREEDSHNLRDSVFLVQGASRGALYDTNTGNVYSINKKGVKVINGELKNNNYWEELHELGLTTLNAPPEDVSTLIKEVKAPTKLNFVWLEIEDKCNEQCVHCYGQFGHEPVSEEDRLSHRQWKRTITDISKEGTSSIQFIGGEPLMYKGNNHDENVFDLIKHAKGEGIENIEIFTNGTNLTDKKISLLKELDIVVAVSLYSDDPETHDSITQTPGSYKLTTRAINSLLDKDVPVRIGFVVMKENQQTVETTMAFLRDLGIEGTSPDIVRPGSNDNNNKLTPDNNVNEKYGLTMSPNFFVTKDRFNRNKHANTCLDGKVAITTEGSVIPCIFSRDMVLGNVNEQPLKEIIDSTETINVWTTTKDNVMVCTDCEYRYACNDCRPLANNTNGGNNYYDAPPARCTYNPYTGEWGKGVWRLKEGEPIYEKTWKGGDKK